MPLSNVLVVVVDGLRASALGAYGNTTYSTSTLDQFAAESLLLDECYAPAADLAMIYRALWQSRHPARPDRGNTERNTALGNGISLPHIFAQLGFDTTLVTDAAELAEFPCAADFHQVRVQIDPADEAAGAERVDDIVETKFAQLLAAVHGDITQRSNEFQQFAGTNTERPRLIWVHSQGMHGPWDAPLDLQHELFDEEDAPPLETTIPPNIWIVPDADPDIAYRHSIAYAAQVVVLDTCWQKLMDSLIASNSPHPWLVILVGAGFSAWRASEDRRCRFPATRRAIACPVSDSLSGHPWPVRSQRRTHITSGYFADVT